MEPKSCPSCQGKGMLQGRNSSGEEYEWTCGTCNGGGTIEEENFSKDDAPMIHTWYDMTWVKD